MLAACAAASADEKERQLIAVLRSDAPPQEKAITCKKLAICGTKEAVPALAPLLSDEKLASWARIALEAIPDPASDAALREAAGKLKGRLLVGVINSIGVRRDAKAIETLASVLKGDDPEAASAAAVALGRIGGTQAGKILEGALTSSAPAVRSAAAEGCVLCAEGFLGVGKADEAVRLYDLVRRADVPKQRILDGTRGAILARKSAGIPMLLELLKSEDKALSGIALSTARELPGGDVTEALVKELGRIPPDRQPLLVLALSDRGDSKALPFLLEVIQNGPKSVALAAINAMERIGNASCVAVLLKAALSSDAELAGPAKSALARLPGAETDAEIAARLPRSRDKERQVLAELAGQRRIEAALPALVSLIEDADPAVRAAAAAAVGAMGGERELPGLIKALQKAKDAGEREGIEKALMAVAARVGAASVLELVSVARAGDGPQRVIAIHALACAGGPEALEAVTSAIDDKDETVRDEAVRTLSNWPNRWPEDAGAAGPLVSLARSAKKVSHQVLALRGYLQYLQGNKKLRDDERLAGVREVLPLIARPDERRLAVSVLAAVPTGGALDMLAALADDPAVAEEAGSAIVGLAERKDLKDASKEQRRKALSVAAEKAKSGSTRKKAQKLLKAVGP